MQLMVVDPNTYDTEKPEVEARLQSERLAIELVVALRGRRSKAELSRRIGYRSNIVQRWEAGTCWPTAARYLQINQQLRGHSKSWLEQFFSALPPWAADLEPESKQAVAAFLRHLCGNTPIAKVAKAVGSNRYTVARWLEGTASPKLPQFLHFVGAISRRLVDVAAALEDPRRLPSVVQAWKQLELARRAAYDLPWSHGVLRALEVADAPRGLAAQRAWIARHLQIPASDVLEALVVLEATGQVHKSRSGYRLTGTAAAIDTSADPVKARGLKAAWLSTALQRLEPDGEQSGRFGYSVFAVSRTDLLRLHTLHLQYVRAFQQVIADSGPSECVGLYCSALLDLGGSFPED